MTIRFLLAQSLGLPLAFLAAPALAQSVTVQQPVVDVFNVSTVVSVPDRGSVLLGGVSRAADGRFNSSLVPFGSSLGSERSHGSAWASVYIHDFEALDAELLATPVAGRGSEHSFRSPLAASAYHSLMRGSSAGLAQRSRTASPTISAAPLRTVSTNSLSPQAQTPEATSARNEADRPVLPSPADPIELAQQSTSTDLISNRTIWSARLGRRPPGAAAVTQERFGSTTAPADDQTVRSSSSSSAADSSRFTNSSDSPAASRASR